MSLLIAGVFLLPDTELREYIGQQAIATDFLTRLSAEAFSEGG